MISEEMKTIIDQLKEKRKMSFLDAATEEQITSFEKEHEITFPVKYKEWLEFSDGGELYLPAGIQLYGVAHRPIVDVDDNDRPNENYIVIGAMANGDPIVFEKGKEDISIYNHEDDRIEEDETYEDFQVFIADLDNILGIGG